MPAPHQHRVVVGVQVGVAAAASEGEGFPQDVQRTRARARPHNLQRIGQQSTPSADGKCRVGRNSPCNPRATGAAAAVQARRGLDSRFNRRDMVQPGPSCRPTPPGPSQLPSHRRWRGLRRRRPAPGGAAPPPELRSAGWMGWTSAACRGELGSVCFRHSFAGPCRVLANPGSPVWFR